MTGGPWLPAAWGAAACSGVKTRAEVSSSVKRRETENNL